MIMDPMPIHRRKHHTRHLTSRLPKARQHLGSPPAIPKNDFISYPSRPVLDVLPQFRRAASVRHTTAVMTARLIQFVAAEYCRGRSLRELAEQTGRTQTAVRRALDEAA